jgi:hypothetical protein
MANYDYRSFYDLGELQKAERDFGGILPKDFIDKAIEDNGGTLPWEVTEYLAKNFNKYAQAYGDDPNWLNKVANSGSAGLGSGFADQLKSAGQSFQNTQAYNKQAQTQGSDIQSMLGNQISFDAQGRPIMPEYGMSEADVNKIYDTTRSQMASMDPTAANQQIQSGLGQIQQIYGKMPDVSDVVNPYLGQLGAADKQLAQSYEVTNLAQPDINNLRTFATGEGPTKQAQYLQQANEAQRQAQQNQTVGQANQGLGLAQSQLMMRGGLSSGSRDRLAKSSMQQLLDAQQQNDFGANQANLGILSTDEARKLDVLKSLPGQQIGLGGAMAGIASQRAGVASTGAGIASGAASADIGKAQNLAREVGGASSDIAGNIYSAGAANTAAKNAIGLGQAGSLISRGQQAAGTKAGYGNLAFQAWANRQGSKF